HAVLVFLHLDLGAGRYFLAGEGQGGKGGEESGVEGCEFHLGSLRSRGAGKIGAGFERDENTASFIAEIDACATENRCHRYLARRRARPNTRTALICPRRASCVRSSSLYL